MGKTYIGLDKGRLAGIARAILAYGDKAQAIAVRVGSSKLLADRGMRTVVSRFLMPLVTAVGPQSKISLAVSIITAVVDPEWIKKSVSKADEYVKKLSAFINDTPGIQKLMSQPASVENIKAVYRAASEQKLAAPYDETKVAEVADWLLFDNSDAPYVPGTSTAQAIKAAPAVPQGTAAALGATTPAASAAGPQAKPSLTDRLSALRTQATSVTDRLK